MAIRQTDGLGTLLKRYRAALGLTQEELAERAGVSARSISDLERGLARTPHLSTIRRLADALELTPTQRSVFMAAGSQARGGDDFPAVREARLRLPSLVLSPARRAVDGVALGLLVLAVAAVFIGTRVSSPRLARAQPAVYSTAQAPTVLGSWGTTPAKTASFGPDIDIITLGPAGYDYVVSLGPVFTALRFSPDGHALDAFPVSDPATGIGDAEADARGNLWVTTRQGIRKFSPQGRLLAHWSPGFNPAVFDSPVGIGFAHNGDVVAGDYYSHRILVFTPAMKLIRQWSGPGKDPRTFSPQAVAFDAQDDVYVLDEGDWQIEKYTLQGKLLGIWRPQGLRKPPPGATGGVDFSVEANGEVYVTESTGQTLSVEKLSSSGQELTRWTSLGPDVSAPGTVDALRFTPAGYGYMGFTDGRMLKVDGNLHVLASWTVQQLRRPLFRSPVAMASGGDGQVYVADAATRQIVGLSTRTGSLTRWKAPVDNVSTGPLVSSMAVDPDGNLALTEGNGTRLDVYAPDGKLIRRSGTSLTGSSTVVAYTGVGFDGHGNLSVLTYPQSTVKTFSPSGRLVQSWCAVCNIPTPNTPATMQVTPAGNVYVAAPSQIVELSPEGIPLRAWNAGQIAGRGTIFYAAGFAVDRHGNLYVSDLDNNALEVFSPSGRKLAFWTRLGPNGPTLSDLGAVTVDAQGNIFLFNGKSLLELAPLRAR